MPGNFGAGGDEETQRRRLREQSEQVARARRGDFGSAKVPFETINEQVPQGPSPRERRNRRVERAAENAAAMHRLVLGAGRGYRGSVVRANAPAGTPAPARQAPPPPQKITVEHKEAVVPLQERGPLPGAANGVFVLGFGLAAVATYRPWIMPLFQRAYHGNQSAAPFATPNTGTISLVLFVLGLVFVASLSPDLAQLVFFFLIGLWAVFLIMNPAIMQSVFSWVSQGNVQLATSGNAPPVTDTRPGQKGPR